MTQTNGINIDLRTYRKFCRIITIIMIKLTGVVNLQYLRGDRERKRERDRGYWGNKANEEFTSAGAAE